MDKQDSLASYTEVGVASVQTVKSGSIYFRYLWCFDYYLYLKQPIAPMFLGTGNGLHEIRENFNWANYIDQLQKLDSACDRVIRSVSRPDFLDEAIMWPSFEALSLVFDEFDSIDTSNISKSGSSIRPLLSGGSPKADRFRTLCDAIIREFTDRGCSLYELDVAGTTQVGRADQPFAPSIVLSGMQLVDADALDWETILALREDPEARGALRDLRLMLAADYAGKPASFIEDSLASKIDAYDRTVKSWNLSTKDALLEAAFSKGRAAQTALFGFVTGQVVTGSLIAAVASGVASGAFSIGSVALEVQRRQKRKDELLADSPVRYLINLRDAAES